MNASKIIGKKKRGGVRKGRLRVLCLIWVAHSGVDGEGWTRSPMWTSRSGGPGHVIVPKALGPNQLKVMTVAPLAPVT